MVYQGNINLKIYSKTGMDFSNLYSASLFKISDNQLDLTVPQIFSYGIFDYYKYNIPFEEALDIAQWDNLRTFGDSVLLYENHSETILVDHMVGQINHVVQHCKINPNQIYVLLADELHVDSLLYELSLKNILGVNVDYYNKWLMEIPIPLESSTVTTKKFSAFSRRLDQDRLNLFFELVIEDLIKEFEYSFNNIDPYAHKTHSLDQIRNMVSSEFEIHNGKLFSWIEGLPYRANGDPNYVDINSSSLTESILSTDIHLIIETNFTPIQQHPIAWLTEKTWRAIACSKPFLLYSTPNALSYVRKCGYKTFSTCIDESYDTILDNSQRRKAIVKEIKRISQLPHDEYLHLVNSCKSITEYNLQVLLSKKQKQLSDKFKKLGIFKLN